MDGIDIELADVINMALADGYDVEIKITERRDGRDGRLKLPMAWVNRLADRKLASEPIPHFSEVRGILKPKLD